jgi:nucleoside-diphosphate-sugar epimerase
MKVLVTGGTGYLGQAIVRAVASRGHEPIVLARRATAAACQLPAAARVDADVRDRDALLRAARGADAICHAAALVSAWRRDPADFDRVNVGGLETVIDVCATLGIPRLVYTSSFLAQPPRGMTRALEANGYQRSKVRARETARRAAARGVPLVILVPGVVYGPGAGTEGNLVERMVRDHLRGRLPGIIGPERIWSFSFVEDVAAAHASALESGDVGEEYGVGGENVPQMRLFELIREATGAPLPRRIPRIAAAAAGWLQERTSRAPRLTAGTVRILQHDWPVDSSRSVGKLNYRITPLVSGVRTLLAGIS